MRAALAHVQTWRPYTLWYVGLVSVAGAGLAGGGSWLALLGAWLVPTVGWIGGHYLSDWFDRRLDAVSKPQRPIPSGRLSATTALACGLGCLAAVLAAAAAGGPATTLVTVGAVAGIVGYGRWFKARGLAGNLSRGALGALVLAYGAATVGAPRGWAAAAFAAFVVAFCAHDTATNLVGTLRDAAGDQAGGYRTVPVVHGLRTAAALAALCYGLAVAAALAGGALHPGPFAGFAAVLVPTAGLGLVALRAPLGRVALPARAALRAHELLVVERVGFAAAVIALGFGLATALWLLVPALTVTWWTQARLRAAHEFAVPVAAPPDRPSPE